MKRCWTPRKASSAMVVPLQLVGFSKTHHSFPDEGQPCSPLSPQQQQSTHRHLWIVLEESDFHVAKFPWCAWRLHTRTLVLPQEQKTWWSSHGLLMPHSVVLSFFHKMVKQTENKKWSSFLFLLKLCVYVYMCECVCVSLFLTYRAIQLICL